MISLAMRIAFWLANKKKEAKALMRGWNRKIAFNIEGTPPFHVKIQDGAASLVKEKCDTPDLVVKASSKNFRLMLKGKIQFEEAFLRKKIEAVGSIHDAARFKRIIGLVLETYSGPIAVFRSLFGRFM